MDFPLVRDAVRLVRRNPALSAVAVMSLAIGITINATAFSVIDALVLRPLPIADPAGLVRIYSMPTGAEAGGKVGVSYSDFLDVQQSVRSFASLAAFMTAGTSVGPAGETPEIVTLGVVSTDYFSLLGVNAQVGRVFGEIDVDLSRAPAALISDRYWRRKYSADPRVVGRTIRLNSRAWTIVGVLPEGFGGTQPLLAPAIWVPVDVLSAAGRPTGPRGSHEYAVFARLAPGASLEQADLEVRAIGDTLAAQYARTNGGRTLVAEFESSARRKNLSVIIAIGIGIVSLPLLIACANVMGLLLGRAEERRREMAIRIALGGSRGRLVRQLLSETALLSALAVAASLLCAWWVLHLIPAMLPPLPIEVNLDLRIDTRIGLATVAVALAATMLAGLAPALMAARTDLTPIIKGHDATAVSLGRRRITLRNALVTGQIAVMFLLLESGALLTVSLFNANRTDPGFAPGAMAFATLVPGAAGYDRPRSEELYRRLIARVRQLPNVDAAAFARHVPLNSLYGGGAAAQVVIPGHQPPAGRDAFAIRNNLVSAGYFDTIGARLVRGRDFDERDRADGEKVAVINQTMARTYWPGGDPIGQRVGLLKTGEAGGASASASTDREACVIVGVVEDTKYLTLGETTPAYMFFPMSQRSAGEITLIARGRGDEAPLAGQLRQTIVALDPQLPAMDILTRSEHLRRALFAERTLAKSAAGLGGLSVVLAVVGVYGVVAFFVSRRTREIGIAMALGATPTQVMRSVLGFGAKLAGAGILIGACLGVLLAWALAGSLHGVSATDPRMFLAAAIITWPVALAATYLPARRAARIDPIVALRE